MQARQHLGTLIADMERWATQPAVVEHRGVRTLRTSYATLAQGACAFAAELEQRGIGPGERVLLWGENSAAWIACFFGCVLRGVLVVPLDAKGGAAFAQRVLGETTPRLVAGDAALLRQLAPGDYAQLPFQYLRAELRADLRASTRPPSEERPAISSNQLQQVLHPSVNLDTPLQIIFTSGTTGDPKGIVHTHRNLLASLGPIEREISKYRRYERWVHPLRMLHTLPLSHVYGQFMGLWIAPVLGATVHYESRMEPARLLGTLHGERIHVLAAVPRVLTLLRGELLDRHAALAAELPRAAHLPLARRWWRFLSVHRQLGYRFWAVVCGGATLPPELEAFWTTVGVALIQGYGMTETSALITLNHPFKPARGTLGAALPGRELQMTDDGELLVRGEMVATGRWHNGQVQATAGDGWLRTGDLARRDEQGRLHYLGRTGERLVTAAGLNVYLQDVEAALRLQAGVQDAAAIGMEGAQGPMPAAILLAHDEQTAAAAVLAANATLQPHQRIARWWRWPGLDLPRTATGKVQRPALQAWVEERLSQEAVAEAGGPTHTQGQLPENDPLRELIARITGQLPEARIAAPGDQGDQGDQEQLPLEALGLDSLARVQLQTALEEAGAGFVSESALGAACSLGDLRAAIRLPPYPPELSPVQSTIKAPGSRGEHASAGRSDETPTAGVRNPPDMRFLYPGWPASSPVQLLRAAFIECVLRPVVWLLARPRVVWHGTGTPATLAGEPVLIVSNHVSAYDVPLLLYALPGHLRRHMAVAAAGEMMEDWRHARGAGLLRYAGPAIFLLLSALFHAFPLPRSRGFGKAFAYAGRVMDQGYSVLVFPEGTRSHGGPVQHFRGGVGLLAQQAGARVLPLALEQRRGSESALRPFAVTVHIGKPVLPGSIAGEDTPKALALLLEKEVRSLLPVHANSK